MICLWVVPLIGAAQSSYQTDIQHRRDSINQFFKMDSHSPLDSADRILFIDLAYFNIDAAYNVPCTFKKQKRGKKFRMKTTTDRLPAYRVYGTMHFFLDSIPLQLTIYQNIELSKRTGYEDYLFCPFKDQTNGEESYGGGRYLDFRMKDVEKGMIDFNLCYNPYCAYNYRYSCPIPPKSNHLNIAIQAGVKKFH